jgi:hypothetical protein
MGHYQEAIDKLKSEMKKMSERISQIEEMKDPNIDSLRHELLDKSDGSLTGLRYVISLYTFGTAFKKEELLPQCLSIQKEFNNFLIRAIYTLEMAPEEVKELKFNIQGERPKIDFNSWDENSFIDD